MEVNRAITTVLYDLQIGKIPASIIGEIALNYYNVPRVLHDIEICVPASFLSQALYTLCSTKRYKLMEKKEYDIFTEYKRAFPVLAAIHSNIPIVIFPDSHFHLSPLGHNIVSYNGVLGTSYSREILDLVPVDEIQYLPVPRLPPYFIGLCRRFFESNDDMARISAEQLVDGMDLDEEWIRINLSGAPLKVRELATTLVAEKSSRIDASLDLIMPRSALESSMEGLRLIPGSGY
ncbi:hypothetical protein BDV28DRAFT_145560 [Aspergillus coremiiformis]|uniref:Uncharacterized protein n=1 Tax=Aspergillus coremiiformis TaxID=138285 RepID=A0A5N6ZEG8_9EURO|nr:hypothetical protein BDV28DRAFT_145560 [Aspergillus coremiiformis]